jgi:hypothetical protein
MWKGRKDVLADATQPYDTSLKALLEGHAEEILFHLLAAQYVDELNIEVLRPSLRADRVYLIRQAEHLCIAHLELESGPASEMVYRMLEYYGLLQKKYRRPILPIIIYPFRTSSLPESPLRITIGDRLILEFHFQVIEMWKHSAKFYVDNHVIGMYPLLPTMQDAIYERLVEALEEMEEWYKADRKKLGERIVWFDVFLERSDMVSAHDKERLEAKLHELGSYVKQSRLVRQILTEAVAEAKVEAKAEGLAEGEVKALQKVLVEMVKGRFPPLAELAQQRVGALRDPQKLALLVKGHLHCS